MYQVMLTIFFQIFQNRMRNHLAQSKCFRIQNIWVQSTLVQDVTIEMKNYVKSNRIIKALTNI